MAISFWEVSITNNRLEFPDHAFDAHSGAVIDFWGIVRAIEDDREIEGIDYEVHQPMAEHQMNLLAEKAKHDFCLTMLILRHRIGFRARKRTFSFSAGLRASSRRCVFGKPMVDPGTEAEGSDLEASGI